MDEPVALEQCAWLNISVCNATVTASVKQQPFQVVVFNPLAWKRSTPIRVPVALKLHGASANAAWDVTGAYPPSCHSPLILIIMHPYLLACALRYHFYCRFHAALYGNCSQLAAALILIICFIITSVPPSLPPSMPVLCNSIIFAIFML